MFYLSLGCSHNGFPALNIMASTIWMFNNCVGQMTTTDIKAINAISKKQFLGVSELQN